MEGENPKTLLDLNDHCVRHILDYLNFKDRLNFANSGKQFRRIFFEDIGHRNFYPLSYIQQTKPTFQQIEEFIVDFGQQLRKIVLNGRLHFIENKDQSRIYEKVSGSLDGCSGNSSLLEWNDSLKVLNLYVLLGQLHNVQMIEVINPTASELDLFEWLLKVNTLKSISIVANRMLNFTGSCINLLKSMKNLTNISISCFENFSAEDFIEVCKGNQLETVNCPISYYGTIFLHGNLIDTLKNMNSLKTLTLGGGHAYFKEEIESCGLERLLELKSLIELKIDCEIPVEILNQLLKGFGENDLEHLKTFHVSVKRKQSYDQPVLWRHISGATNLRVLHIKFPNLIHGNGQVISLCSKFSGSGLYYSKQRANANLITTALQIPQEIDIESFFEISTNLKCLESMVITSCSIWVDLHTGILERIANARRISKCSQLSINFVYNGNLTDFMEPFSVAFKRLNVYRSKLVDRSGCPCDCYGHEN